MMPIWKTTLRIRLVELEIAKRYGQLGGAQPMRCPVHLSIGQEWVAATVCADLEPQDWIVASHRNHAAYLAKGGDLKKMLAELYGRPDGCCGGRGGSMHLMDVDAGVMWCDPIVGAGLGVALGMARRIAETGENRVVVAFCGDAAVEEGIFHETINLARLWRLPLGIVIEDNALSVDAEKKLRQTADFPEYPVLSANSRRRLRGDLKPFVARAGVSRLCEHCGPRHGPNVERLPLGFHEAPSEAEEILARGEILAEIETAFLAVEETPS